MGEEEKIFKYKDGDRLIIADKGRKSNKMFEDWKIPFARVLQFWGYVKYGYSSKCRNLENVNVEVDGGVEGGEGVRETGDVFHPRWPWHVLLVI